VIAGATETEELKVIAAGARTRSASLILGSELNAHQPPLKDLQLPLLGQHQYVNAAVAVAAVRVLSGPIPVSDSTLRRGLSKVRWPGRLQLLTGPGDQQILLDGAHNPAGAEALRVALDQYFPRQSFTLMLGVLGDKNWAAICETLAPRAARILLTPVGSERSASPADLAAACHKANPAAEATVWASVEEALGIGLRSPFLLVTGSLYLVGEVLEKLGQLTSSQAERGLNEWGSARLAPSRRAATEA